MIGICIKAGFTCPDCDSYIPMNALVKNLRCPACGTDHDITVDHWKMRLREGSVSESFEDSIFSNATLLNHGLYWKAISKYLEYFSADKIIVVFF